MIWHTLTARTVWYIIVLMTRITRRFLFNEAEKEYMVIVLLCEAGLEMCQKRRLNKGEFNWHLDWYNKDMPLQKHSYYVLKWMCTTVRFPSHGSN